MLAVFSLAAEFKSGIRISNAETSSESGVVIKMPISANPDPNTEFFGFRSDI